MAEVKKTSVQAVITTIGGFEYTADDATTPGVGTAAYGSLMAERTIIGNDSGTITIIPWHAVDHAVVTITRTSEEAPEDPTCIVEDDGGDTPEP